MDMVVKRFDIYFASLDPALSSEIKKARPNFYNFSLINSPNFLKPASIAAL
jgi:hypothetical protein